MRKKQQNTGPPEEKKSKKTKKENATASQAAKEFESNLPEIAKKHNIRVSKPYGYYPEDVDKVLTELDTELERLKKDYAFSESHLQETQEQNKALKGEIAKLKMQMSLMEVPDTSAETDFAMMSRMGTITGNNEEQVISNKVIKSPPKKASVNIIKSPTTKTEDNSEKKKSPNVISLNLKKRSDE